MRDRILILAFLALVALPLPLDRVLARCGLPLPGRPFARSAGAIELPADLIDGSAGSKLENRLLRDSFLARGLTAGYNELAFLLLSRTPPAARLGRDEWIFVSARVIERPDFCWAHLKDAAVRDIAGVAGFLRERGARLVVGLIPDRARLQPDRAYWLGRVPEGKGAFLPDVAKALESDGIEVVLLTEPLSALRDQGIEPVYANDHHWTSRGAERAALALAEAARRLLPTPARRPGPKPFEITWDEDAVSPGSLVRKLGFRPGSTLEAVFQVREPRLHARPSSAPRAVLEEEASPAWEGSCASYWATSFGEWGSPQVFANAIGCPVRIRSWSGRGSDFGPAEEIGRVRAEHPDLRGHVFIWEIPEYHLVAPRGRPAGLPKTRAALGAASLGEG